jgi:hypothetical protein
VEMLPPDVEDLHQVLVETPCWSMLWMVRRLAGVRPPKPFR